jgi:hypothetical protein
MWLFDFDFLHYHKLSMLLNIYTVNKQKKKKNIYIVFIYLSFYPFISKVNNKVFKLCMNNSNIVVSKWQGFIIENTYCNFKKEKGSSLIFDAYVLLFAVVEKLDRLLFLNNFFLI